MKKSTEPCWLRPTLQHSNTPTSSRRSAAFTLIELLVVVAVIALLAALLLPALKGARERSKAIDCVSNLRQVHIGFHLFALDNDGYYPWTDNWVDSLGTKGYFGAGETYYGRKRWPVLRCRAEQRYSAGGRSYTMYDDETSSLSSYAINWIVNAYHYRPGYCGPDSKPRRFESSLDGILYNPNTSEQSPVNISQAMYVTDFVHPFFPVGTPFYNYYEATIDTDAYRYFFRHIGKTINGLFLDGHVEPRRHFLDTAGTLDQRNWQYIWQTAPDGRRWDAPCPP